MQRAGEVEKLVTRALSRLTSVEMYPANSRASSSDACNFWSHFSRAFDHSERIANFVSNPAESWPSAASRSERRASACACSRRRLFRLGVQRGRDTTVFDAGFVEQSGSRPSREKEKQDAQRQVAQRVGSNFVILHRGVDEEIRAVGSGSNRRPEQRQQRPAIERRRHHR